MTTTTTEKMESKWKPWAWFAALWLAGFLTMGAVSLIIRALMNIG